MQYSKPAITVAQQITQLKSRGLLIADEQIAEHYLINVSYYRLAGYWWPLQENKNTHQFKPGSKFETVIDLYNFDRELRLVLFDAIERIEIGFRTRLIYELSLEHGAWWFENERLFKNSINFYDNLNFIDKELLRSKEVFIKEHHKKYATDSRRPPSWKTLEVVTLGQLSKIYGNLNNVPAKDRIADSLKIPNHTYLHSWLQSISQMRNFCAHHARIWNKNLPGRPKLLKKAACPWLSVNPPVNEHNMLYTLMCCMKYLLHTISPANHFTNKISDLLSKYPNIDLRALGFPHNWFQEELWKN